MDLVTKAMRHVTDLFAKYCTQAFSRLMMTLWPYYSLLSSFKYQNFYFNLLLLVLYIFFHFKV